MISVRRHSATAVAFGLLAATLYAGSTAGATAGTPAETPACPQATSTGPGPEDAVTASDDADSAPPAACTGSVAGALCAAVWQTAAPLLRGRSPGISLLCMAMALPLRTSPGG